MPSDEIELFNFRYSVYGRIVRVVLAEKKIEYKTREINPFAEDIPKDYLDVHPFKRVPAIRHGDFILYETNAITQYLDDTFNGPSLRPANVTERARALQVISIIDNYGYLPHVRKVFSESFFQPKLGEAPDENVVQEGLQESARVLDALEKLKDDKEFIAAATYSLADAHVIPMIDYFTMAKEGAEMLRNYPKLTQWWDRMKERPSTLSTRPALPT